MGKVQERCADDRLADRNGITVPVSRWLRQWLETGSQAHDPQTAGEATDRRSFPEAAMTIRLWSRGLEARLPASRPHRSRMPTPQSFASSITESGTRFRAAITDRRVNPANKLASCTARNPGRQSATATSSIVSGGSRSRETVPPSSSHSQFPAADPPSPPRSQGRPPEGRPAGPSGGPAAGSVPLRAPRPGGGHAQQR